MESIFAKPPASASHNYIYLLQKKEIISQNSKQQFSHHLPSPVHLYSSSGLSRGHRKLSSTDKPSPELQICESMTDPVPLYLTPVPQSLENETLRLRSELESQREANLKLQLRIQEFEFLIKQEQEKHKLI